jgi:hypothetical protein
MSNGQYLDESIWLDKRDLETVPKIRSRQLFGQSVSFLMD